MRLLVISPSLMRAGAETQAVDLCNGLSARGHAVHLCTFGPQLDQRARIGSGVQFHHLQRESRFDFSVVRELGGLIDRHDIGVVLGVMQFATMLAWMARVRSRSKPPVVGAIHTTVNKGWKEELQDRVIYRNLLRRLPALIFVCENQRAHWVGKYPELESISRVVHNGVEPARFRREDFMEKARALRASLGIPGGAFVFSCIAAFRPEKGHHLLIEAFSRLPGVPYLLLAGDGECRSRVEADARNRGIQDRVLFLGSVADTRPVIVASDATVLASTAVETFSMAMLESMALGVPMIAPEIGGLPEAIEHEETGMLFAVGDLEGLVGRMSQLLSNPSMANAMGAGAHSRIQERFTLAGMVSGTENVLEQACGGSGRG